VTAKASNVLNVFICIFSFFLWSNRIRISIIVPLGKVLHAHFIVVLFQKFVKCDGYIIHLANERGTEVGAIIIATKIGASDFKN
jgi:hypothetical protein